MNMDQIRRKNKFRVVLKFQRVECGNQEGEKKNIDKKRLSCQTRDSLTHTLSNN